MIFGGNLMSAYAVLWIVLAVVFGIIEASTVNFVTIWFAIGAVFAFVTAIITDSLLFQVAVFTGISVLSLILTRPFVKKVLNNKTVATNADRYINQKAYVTQTINGVSGSGQIKSMGQIWSAKSEDGLDINEGEEVIINRIDGVRAVVSKIN